MSPDALELAITALESEVDLAVSWYSETESTETKAVDVLQRAAAARREAVRRIEHAREALEYLQGLREPEAGAQRPDRVDDFELDEVPDGVEVAGGGVRVWTSRPSEDEL